MPEGTLKLLECKDHMNKNRIQTFKAAKESSLSTGKLERKEERNESLEHMKYVL